MFGVKRIPYDGRNMARSPAFDHSLRNFKGTKTEFNLTFNGTFLELYKSYLNSPYITCVWKTRWKILKFHWGKLFAYLSVTFETLSKLIVYLLWSESVDGLINLLHFPIGSVSFHTETNPSKPKDNVRMFNQGLHQSMIAEFRCDQSNLVS